MCWWWCKKKKCQSNTEWEKTWNKNKSENEKQNYKKKIGKANDDVLFSFFFFSINISCCRLLLNVYFQFIYFFLLLFFMLFPSQFHFILFFCLFVHFISKWWNVFCNTLLYLYSIVYNIGLVFDSIQRIEEVLTMGVVFSDFCLFIFPLLFCYMVFIVSSDVCVIVVFRYSFLTIFPIFFVYYICITFCCCCCCCIHRIAV